MKDHRARAVKRSKVFFLIKSDLWAWIRSDADLGNLDN